MAPRALVLTVVGPDRPGIVDQVSAKVAEHGGNWEESRMARLAGSFAGILKVSVEETRVPEFMDGLADLRGVGLDVTARPAHALHATPDAQPGARLKVALVGADHEGIVRDVARVLAQRGINIEDMVTDTTDAPMAGHKLFRAELDVKTPFGLDSEELTQALERLADDLMVEIGLDANPRALDNELKPRARRPNPLDESPKRQG